MAKIKWTKDDVINKFQEAVTPQLSPKTARPGGGGLASKFMDIIAKRKAGPGAGAPPVTGQEI